MKMCFNCSNENGVCTFSMHDSSVREISTKHGITRNSFEVKKIMFSCSNGNSVYTF